MRQRRKMQSSKNHCFLPTPNLLKLQGSCGTGTELRGFLRWNPIHVKWNALTPMTS